MDNKRVLCSVLVAVIVLVILGIIGYTFIKSSVVDGDGMENTDIEGTVQNVEGDGGDISNEGNGSDAEKVKEKIDASAFVKNILSEAPYSYKALVKILKDNGYSEKEAINAVDNCGVDWKDMALNEAELHMQNMMFTKDMMETQLQEDGYSEKQIKYVINKLGL